jgi:hypothetical protein
MAWRVSLVYSFRFMLVAFLLRMLCSLSISSGEWGGERPGVSCVEIAEACCCSRSVRRSCEEAKGRRKVDKGIINSGKLQYLSDVTNCWGRGRCICPAVSN